MLVQAAFAWLLCLASAAPTISTPFEKLERVPRGWSFVREAKPGEVAKFSVSLRQQNLEQLEQFVLDVSTPNHPSYGQHMPKHELADLVGPATEAIETVREWLINSNVTGMHEDGNWVVFWTTVEKANAIFNTNFDWYMGEKKEEKLRTMQYSVPSHVSEHINFVEPTVKFPSVRPMKSAIHAVQRVKDLMPLTSRPAPAVKVPGVDSACQYEITPTCLMQLYNIYYTGNGTNGNKIAFASFLKQWARTKMLTKFEKALAPWAKGVSFNVVEFNGGKNKQASSQDSIEANLDDQYITALAYPAPVTEFSTGGCGPLTADPNEPKGSCDNEPYMRFLNGVLALDDDALPQTISISYGEDEQTWPLAQANAVCSLFMQLGARGVSVLVASGDYGPGNICENNAGTVKQFVPNFPASCPWVTVVGGTDSIGPEEATSLSGGGFSNYYARPSWQNSAVSGYLATTAATKFSKYYNASGRGYPDVAAQALSFEVYDSGYENLVDGTSAATPTFASVISLLNSALISAGKPPLGFLNPYLYSTVNGTFTDITTGSSSGCSGDIANAGFAAVKGWDAATGLGTPDFGKMLKLTVPQACNTKGVIGVNPSSKTCSVPSATGAV